jgi:methylmalonyl-CoA mutase
MREARLRQVMVRERMLTGTSAYPDLRAAEIERVAAVLPEVPSPGKQVEALAPARLAEPFENLRDRADALGREGAPPVVSLVPIGKATETGAVAAEVASILASGGMTAGGADNHAIVACLCASAEVSEGEIGARAADLRAAGAQLVLLAGRPGAGIPGVDATLADGANFVEVLAQALDLFENVAFVQ